MRARAVGKKFPAINNWIYSSEPPDSLTEKKKHLSRLFTRLKIHQHISINISNLHISY